MLINKIVSSWRKIVGSLMAMIFFVCASFCIFYLSNVISTKFSASMNLYWWVEIFKNGKLSDWQFLTYNNLALILYSLIYISFLILIIWSIFEKNKSFLSLSFFIIMVNSALFFSNSFLVMNSYTNFQMIFIFIHKFFSLILLCYFVFQVFSKFWKNDLKQ